MDPDRDRAPRSRANIRSELAALGLPADAVHLVHCSLRRLGPLADGPATLLAGLRDVLGPRSTLIVPTFTARNSTTTRRFGHLTAGMTPAQVAAKEARIDGFDRMSTPAQDVGCFAEFVRRLPGAIRSGHPQTSFAALGPAAAEVMREHDLECHLGEQSPLAKLYSADAIVLLLGKGLDHACTCFHLAEYRLPTPPVRRQYRAYVVEGGRRIVREFLAADLDDRDFAMIAAAMRADSGFVHSGPVGLTTASWFPLRAAVDYAVDWMSRCRGG